MKKEVKDFTLKVSIPFKRESVFRAFILLMIRRFGMSVSIPFKRESVFRVNGIRRTDEVFYFGFNSLQTGKCIQRKSPWQDEKNYKLCFNSLQTGKCIQSLNKKCESGELKFQFPSNGKVYSETGRVGTHATLETVSIPFKRESVFRVNSTLQIYRIRESQVSIPFKRESVFREKNRHTRPYTDTLCFNSLQTGKCIQSGGCARQGI